jgi:hypothetical protein
METLVLLFSNGPVYVRDFKSSGGSNLFKTEKVHPVVRRLGLEEEKEFDFVFRYIETRSEEFGEEKGFISSSTEKKIKLIKLELYQELKEREKELTPDVISIIETDTKYLYNKYREARDNYVGYLQNLGYIEEEIPHDENDTVYLMIHPLFIKEWREHPYFHPLNRYPSWAVINIGHFPFK